MEVLDKEKILAYVVDSQSIEGISAVTMHITNNFESPKMKI